VTHEFDHSTVPQAPSGPTPPPAPPVAKVADRFESAQRRARLARLAGPKQLRAAVLALLAFARSSREMGVLREECAELADLDILLADIQALGAGERLPWLERLLAGIAKGSLADRKQLLHSARRVMAADGRTTAADRLHWLALRHGLGDARSLAAPGAAQMELEQLGEQMVNWIARWSAFLSRLVPTPEVDLDLSADAVAPDPVLPGTLWWHAVMAPWPDADVKHKLPDTDTLVNALQGVQTLAWMLRPVLVRRWVDAAGVLSPAGTLHPASADALRIAARLLESPLPPALASCFVECDDA
jgi:hypothetical protein